MRCHLRRGRFELVCNFGHEELEVASPGQVSIRVATAPRALRQVRSPDVLRLHVAPLSGVVLEGAEVRAGALS